MERLRLEVGSWKSVKNKSLEKGEEFKEKFLLAVNDDLDIPKALAVLWQVVKDRNLKEEEKRALVLDFDQVLGLGLDRVKAVRIPQKVRQLVVRRERLRKQEKWREADKIRAQVEKMGFRIEDTPKGPRVMAKHSLLTPPRCKEK